MFNCSKEVSRVGFKVCRLTSVFHFILVESWFSDFYFIGMKNPKLCHLMELANQKTDFPFLPSRVVFYAWKKAYVSLRLHRKCALQCKQGNRDASFPWQPWDNLRTSIMDTLSEKKVRAAFGHCQGKFRKIQILPFYCSQGIRLSDMAIFSSIKF